MSTNAWNSEKEAPRKAEPPFVKIMSKRFGAIPNGMVRILSQAPNLTLDGNGGPVFPKLAVPYVRTADMMLDASRWSQILKENKVVQVWDVPTILWRDKPTKDLQSRWRNYYKGKITSLAEAQDPTEGEGAHVNIGTPYRNELWFTRRRDGHLLSRYQQEARKQYPRAYETWSDEEKVVLLRRVSDGATPEDISKDLWRQPDACIQRMWQLFPELARDQGLPEPEYRRGPKTVMDNGPITSKATQPQVVGPSLPPLALPGVEAEQQQEPVEIPAESIDTNTLPPLPPLPSESAMEAQIPHSLVHEIEVAQIPHAMVDPLHAGSEDVFLSTPPAAAPRPTATDILTLVREVRGSLHDRGYATREISLVGDLLKRQ
jgi:hypothetical protein